VSSGFEPVRDAFAANFSRGGEPGDACCIHRKAEKIVDLCGGALGYSDPEDGMTYACVIGSMGLMTTVDPRDLTLQKAMDACLASA